MPVLSYLHELFNVDQCHAYLHTLRWKDRPLPVSPVPEPGGRAVIGL
jgi:hypothetical protein